MDLSPTEEGDHSRRLFPVLLKGCFIKGFHLRKRYTFKIIRIHPAEVSVG